jgi:hypothetical protein
MVNGRRTLLGLLAVAALTAGCDRLQDAARTHADLSAVRRAVQPHVGRSTVEVRISNGTTLSVCLVNHPIQLRPDAEKHARARAVAAVAFAAYANRMALDGVQVSLEVRGGFPSFRIGAAEWFRFDRSALRPLPVV